MSDRRVAAIIPARNEEKFIGSTLSALLGQQIRPDKVIVLDDGSSDRTAEVASSQGAEVIRIPDRNYSALGTPVLARVINRGLASLSAEGYDRSSDYVIILGADHLLPSNYLSTIVNLMENHGKVVICSGQIEGERTVVPRGSGRVVRADFWKRIGFSYPENFGFESYLVIKAQQEGYEVRVLDGLNTKTLRKTGKNYKKEVYISYGKSLKALGYSGFYSAARIGLMTIRNPIGAAYMLRGFFSSDVEGYDPELRSYLSSIQHKRIKRYVLNPLKSITNEAA